MYFYDIRYEFMFAISRYSLVLRLHQKTGDDLKTLHGWSFTDGDQVSKLMEQIEKLVEEYDAKPLYNQTLISTRHSQVPGFSLTK